jgi:hypothetical protein
MPHTKKLNAIFGAFLISGIFAGCASMPEAAKPLRSSEPSTLSGQQVFTELKRLAGHWRGHVMKTDGPSASVQWKVTAGGSAVMETQFVGTPHEMVSVYYMDGDALILTHYCAAQNQPRMRLKSAGATTWTFEFAGGTSFDPTKDAHIHEGVIRKTGGTQYEADWVLWNKGGPAETNRFYMKKAQE